MAALLRGEATGRHARAVPETCLRLRQVRREVVLLFSRAGLLRRSGSLDMRPPHELGAMGDDESGGTSAPASGLAAPAACSS